MIDFISLLVLITLIFLFDNRDLIRCLFKRSFKNEEVYYSFRANYRMRIDREDQFGSWYLEKVNSKSKKFFSVPKVIKNLP